MNKKSDDVLLPLLTACAAKDEEAFRRLYDETHKRIFFFAHRIVGDRDMAEDVVAETYMAVWKSAGAFKGRSKVLTWIFGIARNLSMNALKKIRFDVSIDDCHQLSTDGGLNSKNHDRKEVISKGLLKVSAKHREVLDLVFYQGFNYNEIAAILNVPENTVKTRVFYAKKALHETLCKMGVEQNDL
ncbi:MAG: sigma-70 family RNA polymerase sigma factor [Desulfobacteraceae bacterium]|jgi:RNA polymerase sigma-70 factor, ECF subfamily